MDLDPAKIATGHHLGVGLGRTDLKRRLLPPMTEGKDQGERRKGAIQVIVAVAVILYTSALVGREFLELVGIDLGAFGVAGGLLLTAMGFDMLGNGNTRAQGGEAVYEEPAEDASYIVPFATPFIAGPGAITTVITLSAEGTGWTSIATVLIAVTLPLSPWCSAC